MTNPEAFCVVNFAGTDKGYPPWYRFRRRRPVDDDTDEDDAERAAQTTDPTTAALLSGKREYDSLAQDDAQHVELLATTVLQDINDACGAAVGSLDQHCAQPENAEVRGATHTDDAYP